MNNKRGQYWLLAIGFLLMLSATAQRSFAQTTAFTYQGKLTDAGAPANGSFDLQFKLFDALSGGTQIGATVTNNAVAVSGGVFTTMLDFGANAFPGAARWLEISVRPAGGGAFTLLNPRQSIGTVPYALRSLTAGNAAQLGGVDAARYVQQDASNNVSVGGNLTVSGTFSANVINAQTQFNLGGQRILAANLANSSLSLGLFSGNTTGNFNTFLGTGAGNANPTGSSNVFVGDSAGLKNTTGSGNSFVGSSAGAENLGGAGNSYFGHLAGQFNTAGINNSFFGKQAGQNTTSSRNSFFGFEAGKANLGGSFNSFFGASAGAQNTAGAANSFFGDGAGTANTTGSSNSFFGGLAGGENTAGQANAFFGQLSGLRNQGNNNTFLGFAAGSNTGITTPLTGGGNTVVGSNAGSTLTTGNNNTLIGNLSNFGNSNLNFASAIGAQAVVGSNDTIVLGKAAGTYNSVVRPADAVQIPGSLSIGSVILPQAKLYVSGGTSWFQGDSTPLPGVAGKGVAVGFTAEQGYLFAFDYAASTPKNLLLNNPGGNVGIGTTAPGSKLTVAGLIESTTGGIKFPDGTTQTTAATGSGGSAILNQTTLQAGANFNIGGAGTANILNAVTQFNLNGSRILAGAEGGGNLFAGFNAGAVTTGFNNAFFGINAGQVNGSASGNAFFGFNAGASNTFGINNTFVGLSAGLLNASGSDNTFLGAGSGGGNTDGVDNTFVGRSAGAQNSTGAGNAFFGKRAGFGTTTGGLNTFGGWQAGESNVTGEKNVYLGAYTGEFSSTGNNNTFIGTESGRANSNGSNNTFIGYGAQGFVGNNLTNATALGANAVVLQSNSLVLGSINGVNNATADTKVGIGTTAPRHKLEVKNGSALVTNGDVIVSAPGQGVVLTAPNGSCFRLTVSNAGVLSATPISCP